MQKILFSFALQSVKRKKQNSILMSLVLFLSFSFAIIMLSTTESLNQTNEEYRYDTYGMWDTAILDAREWEVESIQKSGVADEIGTSVRYGMINGNSGIGTVDENLIEMGRIQLQEGDFPQNPEEIAMEADILSSLGYSYEIGQKITVPIDISAVLPMEEAGASDGTVMIEKEYLLCGVVKEYSDLWANDSENREILVGAILTEKDAKELATETQQQNPEVSILSPVYQMFFKTDEDRNDIYKLAEEMQKNIVVNNYAYQSEARTNHFFYVGMIFLTTLAAVVCIYMLQIHKQVRQYALFRSLGITKRQLRLILLYETLILCIPAVLAGCVVGGVGTWVLLKVLTEVNTVRVYVKIPVLLTVTGMGIWTLGIFMVRFLIFQIALRQPLSGRIQMDHRKELRYRKYQRVFSILLATIFSGAIIVGTFQYGGASFNKKSAESNLSYRIDTLLGKNAEPISKEVLLTIAQIPGIRDVDAWATEKVDLTFDGIKNCRLVQDLLVNNDMCREGAVEGIGVFLYGIREEDWEEYLDFEKYGIEENAFREGSQVVVLFAADMENGISSPGLSKTEGDQETGIEKGDEITLNFYGVPYKTGDSGYVEESEKMEKIGSYRPEVAAVLWLKEHRYQDKLEFFAACPYTILCSDTAFAKMVDLLPEDYALSFRVTDQSSGYSMGRIYTTREAGYLSTDYVLADTCRKYGIMMENYREVNAAYVQEETQKIIQILTCGGSIVLISWLILWNTWKLSSEKERKKYGILHAIGMSRKQIKRKFIKEALWAGGIAAVSGWMVFGVYFLFYCVYQWKSIPQKFQETTSISRLISYQDEFYDIAGMDSVVIILLTVIVGVIVSRTYYYTKRNILKQDLMEMVREEV